MVSVLRCSGFDSEKRWEITPIKKSIELGQTIVYPSILRCSWSNRDKSPSTSAVYPMDDSNTDGAKAN